MGIANNLHAWTASGLRLARGLVVIKHNQANPPRPQKPLELYGYERCPYCRKVREVLSELDLTFIDRVSPKGAKKKRDEVMARGGKLQFPYLVDPNQGRELYESEAIIDYLVATYGGGERRSWAKMLSPLNTMTSVMASAWRPIGWRVRPGLEERVQPEKMLVLYGFENSPYCRKVREKLNELNLDYEQRNVAKRSRRRPELLQRGGRMMVPFLIDPNPDGEELYESDDIIAYLEKTYGS